MHNVCQRQGNTGVPSTELKNTGESAGNQRSKVEHRSNIADFHACHVRSTPLVSPNFHRSNTDHVTRTNFEPTKY